MERCVEAFNTFSLDMNAWEMAAFEKNDPGDNDYRFKIAIELKKIYDRFLTSKRRLQGKLSEKHGQHVCTNLKNPPTYDPNLETVKRVELLNIKTVLITTESIDPFDSEIKTDKRYTFKFVNEKPLLDKKQVYSSFKEKWINEVL